MKRKGWRYSLIITLMLAAITVFPMSASALSYSSSLSSQSQYSREDYVIDAYDIEMTVNTDNSYDITEKITAYFNVSKHGIYRTIPLTNRISRLDGTQSSNRASVKNLEVSEQYTTETENQSLVIKIGDPDRTITGKKTYTIKYKYSIGFDPLKNTDELYFNLIGTGWEAPIGNVTFKINMPKEFDKSKLGFSAGSYSSTNSSGIDYRVNGNVIRGSYDGVLNPGQALTVRCELPDGYFDEYSLVDIILHYILYIIPLILTVIVGILRKLFGKGEKPVETVEFYPPQGVNSLDAGYDYEGKCFNSHVISLLLYLANKGYIKISEENGFTLYKMKEYDGNNPFERGFFQGLFKFGYAVTASDLKNRFYITMQSIVNDMNSKQNREIILDSKCLKYQKIAGCLTAAIYALIGIKLLSSAADFTSFIAPAIFFGAGMLFLSISMSKKSIAGNNSSSGKSFRLPTIIIGLFLTVISGFVFVELSGMPDIITMICTAVGIVLGLISSKIVLSFDKRTEYGNEMLGKISGFKNFLETAEKDKLEALVEENPTYFFDILPYTYALGVSDKWVKKFETIAVQPPQWYVGHDAFSMVTFGNFMNNTMRTASTAMASSPQSSGGSGGGFSGGGSGGGGGGAW